MGFCIQRETLCKGLYKSRKLTTFGPMKKEKNGQHFVANKLTESEVDDLILEIGRLIKAKRNRRTTIERFAYEINISRSQISKYEAGGDMLLSTFLRILHGLNTSGEKFFKSLNKK